MKSSKLCVVAVLLLATLSCGHKKDKENNEIILSKQECLDCVDHNEIPHAPIKMLFVGADAKTISEHVASFVAQNSQLMTRHIEFFSSNNVLNSYYENRNMPSDRNALLSRLSFNWDVVVFLPIANELEVIPEKVYEETRLLKTKLSPKTKLILYLPPADSCLRQVSSKCQTSADRVHTQGFRIAKNLDVLAAPAGFLWDALLSNKLVVDSKLSGSLMLYQVMAMACGIKSLSEFTYKTGFGDFVAIDVNAAQSVLNQVIASLDTTTKTAQFSGEYYGAVRPLTGFKTKTVFSKGLPLAAVGKNSTILGTSTPRMVYQHLESLLKNARKINVKPTPSAPTFYVIDMLPNANIASEIPALPSGLSASAAYFRFIRQNYCQSDTLNNIGTYAARELRAMTAEPIEARKYMATIPGRIAYGRVWEAGRFLMQYDCTHLSSYASGVYAGLMYAMLFDANPAGINTDATLGAYRDFSFQFGLYQEALNLAYQTYRELKDLKPYPLDTIKVQTTQTSLLAKKNGVDYFSALQSSYDGGTRTVFKVTAPAKYYRAMIERVPSLSIYAGGSPLGTTPIVTSNIYPIDKTFEVDIANQTPGDYYAISILTGQKPNDPIFTRTHNLSSAKRNRIEAWHWFRAVPQMSVLPSDHCDKGDGKIFAPLHRIQLSDAKKTINLGCHINKKFLLVRRYDTIQKRHYLGEDDGPLMKQSDVQLEKCQYVLIDEDGGAVFNELKGKNPNAFYRRASDLGSLDIAFKGISYLGILDTQTGEVIDSVEIADEGWRGNIDNAMPIILEKFKAICQNPLS